MRPIKTYEYIIVLKEHFSYRYIDFISRLMLLIAIISFLFRAYVDTKISHSFDIAGKSGLLVMISCVAVIWWIFCWGQSRRNIVPFYRFALLICAWGWYVYPHTLFLSIIYIVAAILEKPVKLLPEIAFDDNEIVINSFPKKRYVWGDLKNVILKDGIITIDCKNNKLIQSEINEEVSKEVEKEFNNYCKKQLEKAQSPKPNA
jgi:hypothetical protein